MLHLSVTANFTEWAMSMQLRAHKDGVWRVIDASIMVDWTRNEGLVAFLDPMSIRTTNLA